MRAAVGHDRVELTGDELGHDPAGEVRRVRGTGRGQLDVDVAALDVGQLFGNDPARTEDGGLFGAGQLAAHHLVHVVGDHRQFHRLLDLGPGEGLSKEQEAVEAKRLGLLDALETGARRVGGQTPEMHDEVRAAPALTHGFQQREVVGPSPRVDLELVRPRHREG